MLSIVVEISASGLNEKTGTRLSIIEPPWIFSPATSA